MAAVANKPPPNSKYCQRPSALKLVKQGHPPEVPRLEKIVRLF